MSDTYPDGTYLDGSLAETVTYWLLDLFARADLGTPDGRSDVAIHAGELVMGLPDPSLRFRYVLEIGARTRVELLWLAKLAGAGMTPTDRSKEGLETVRHRLRQHIVALEGGFITQRDDPPSGVWLTLRKRHILAIYASEIGALLAAIEEGLSVSYLPYGMSLDWAFK
jgi:hypothetical protein